jgi:hypothetical protein
VEREKLAIANDCVARPPDLVEQTGQ